MYCICPITYIGPHVVTRSASLVGCDQLVQCLFNFCLDWSLVVPVGVMAAAPRTTAATSCQFVWSLMWTLMLNSPETCSCPGVLTGRHLLRVVVVARISELQTQT